MRPRGTLATYGMGIAKMGEVGTRLDTSGLPEFFISDVETEIIGPNVRVVVGCQRCGKIDPLYSAVMQAEDAISVCEKITSTAREAIKRMQRSQRLRVVDH